MLKIACIDKTSAARLELQSFLESAFEETRATLGHIPLGHPYPTSLKELTVSGNVPDVVVVGPQFTRDEAFHCCREIFEQFPFVARLLILPEEEYSLSSVRRFNRVATEIFAKNEPVTRLIHTFWSLIERTGHQPKGQLIVARGVKGGVGTSSLVAALCHAFEGIGKSTLIVDLSQYSALLHYAHTSQTGSPDLAELLVENKRLNKSSIQKFIVQAPNGLHFLLPPSGGRETRELWTRDPSRLDLSLSLIDFALDYYDVVIVDIANTEGILPFGISIRADSTLLITTNEPASIHLLAQTLQDLRSIPSAATINILINRFIDRGLTRSDIIDFLTPFSCFRSEFCSLPEFVPDNRGILWIGTGNTLYTEGTRKTQRTLENIALHIIETNPSSALSRIDQNQTPNSNLPVLHSTNSATNISSRAKINESVQSEKQRSNPFAKLVTFLHQKFLRDSNTNSPLPTTPQFLTETSGKQAADDLEARGKVVRLTQPASTNRSESTNTSTISAVQKVISSIDCSDEQLYLSSETEHGNLTTIRSNASAFSFSKPEIVTDSFTDKNNNVAQAGSLSLEILLFIGAAVIFSASILPTFIDSLSNYSSRFDEEQLQ